MSNADTSTDAPEPELQQSHLEEMLEGTVEDVREGLENYEFDLSELKDLKRLEKSNKNRKTALTEINDRLERLVTQKQSEDIEHLEEELHTLKQELHSSDHISKESMLEIGTLELLIQEGDPVLVVDTGEKKVELQHHHLKEFIRGEGGHSPLSRSNVSESSCQSNSQINSGSQRVQGNSPRNNNFNSGSPGVNQVQNTQQRRPKQQVQNSRTDENQRFRESGPKIEPSTEGVENKHKSEANKEENEPTELELLRRELKENFDLEESDIENKGLDELKELKERLENKEQLKNEIRNRFDVDPSGKDLEELKDLKKELEDLQDKRNDLMNKYGVDEDKVKDKNMDQLKDIEEKFERRQTLQNRLKAYGYTQSDVEDLSVEELEKQISKIDRKKELLEDIGADFDDEELKDLKVKELEKIKREKEEREELINELTEEGYNEDDLRASSTSDLRKITSNLNQQDEIKENSQSIDEIEDEAKEDLELLKGAVKTNKNDEEDTEEKIKKLEKWKEKFKEFKRTNDENEMSDEEIREAKLLEVLQKYEKIDNKVEKSVKTAQVMKGYIEFKLDINRELTYREVSSKLEEIAKSEDDQGLMTLAQFFEDIGTQVYSGRVYIENINEIIEISKSLAREFDQ